ncbi:unnamed protein product [Mytilus edulis]|uniref:Integrase catalytic domain-containing protein n=1 Tax=Mytilus edulis TaxID=6550 RepID=A0A8S3S5U3_MYTED|nr:unnamed protein product [Mytilus edulis]
MTLPPHPENLKARDRLAFISKVELVLGDLSDDKKSHFDQLVRSLEERFAPPNQSELYRVQLKERKQRASETLPELGQTIRRLVNKAYPTAPGEVKETLAKEHFLDALINSAICLAVELETFYKAEKQFEVGKAHLRVVDNNEQVVRESETHDRLSDKIEGMLAAFNDQLANMRKELDEFKNKANMSGPVDRSKFLCYNCGKPGHMARNCNAPRNRRQNNQGSPGPSVRRTNNRSGKRKHKSLYLGSNTLNNEAGLYVELFINGIPAKFLIDTGATVSLVSDTLFEKLKSRDRPSVRQVTQEIIAANGESLKIIGKALFSLKLGSFHTVIEGVIAGLSVEGILGLDFLQTNGCKVDLGKKTVQVTGIIEPSEEFLDRGKALVGKSVVMSDKSVPVRLLNISDSVQVLNVGTVVGNLSGAEVVSQVDNHKDYALNNKLEKLLDRSSENLGHGQKDKGGQDDDLELDIRQLQETDKDLQTVIGWLTTGSKPSYSQTGKHSYVVKSLWSQWNVMKVQDGILFREDPETNLKQVVIPMKERRKILEFAHDNKTAAHLGIKKTLARIKENFIGQVLERKKPIPKRKAPMQVKESGYPMERIAMDILGELPASEKGNKYILVISDYYTKWTESHPMPNMEATTVANILMTEVISRFGVPTIIHSDQGSQFESHLFKEMCKLLQIEKTRTTPYHPKSDGMVERFNKTLATMLTGYVNEYHSNWDVLLPYVMMAYRSSQHETTGYTPNRLMLGREVSTPLDLIYKLPSQVKAIPQNQWAWELQEHMEEAHQIVQRHVSGQMLRQKKNHDKNVSWAKFEPGNMVYVYFPLRTPGLSPKFTNQWRGPYKDAPLSPKILRGELVDEQSPEKTGELESEIHDEEVIIDSLPLLDLDDHEDVDNDRPRRFRKPPSWMKDYER